MQRVDFDRHVDRHVDRQLGQIARVQRTDVHGLLVRYHQPVEPLQPVGRPSTIPTAAWKQLLLNFGMKDRVERA